jgi:D-ribose pyranose/furanose isomerase RbsD
LPQYNAKVNAPYHQFIVFSIFDNSDTVIPKHAACNNCGVIHNVFDIAKSEIFLGQEVGAVMTIDDVSLMLPESLKNILLSYKCDIATWEHVLFILQNNKFPENIIINRDMEDNIVSGKLLSMINHGEYKIQPFSRKVAV